MKKIAVALAVLLLFSSLVTSCAPKSVSYDLVYGTDEIASIAIYYFEESLNGKIDDSYEPLVVLDESRYEEMIQDITGLPFTDVSFPVGLIFSPKFSCYGYVVLITYEDTSYQQISSQGIQWYEDGEGNDNCTHYDCDDEIWLAMIEKYLPVSE